MIWFDKVYLKSQTSLFFSDINENSTIQKVGLLHLLCLCCTTLYVSQQDTIEFFYMWVKLIILFYCDSRQPLEFNQLAKLCFMRHCFAEPLILCVEPELIFYNSRLQQTLQFIMWSSDFGVIQAFDLNTSAVIIYMYMY